MTTSESGLDKYILVGIIVGSTMLVICTWLITDFCLYHREKAKHKEKKSAKFYTKKPKRLQMHHVSMQVPLPVPNTAAPEASTDKDYSTAKSPRTTSPVQAPLSPTGNTLSPIQNKLKKKLKKEKAMGSSPRNVHKKSSNEKGSFKLSEDEESDFYSVINDEKATDD
ncbi:uncharacterized protein LOC133204760 [Saccostrea echinata]|uniref:uncharacterized protein LOC133204760 n=1 Tax=Saccostrea echinata TaxID=191078 RepID=UPI002A81A982|nr:uncharacterized protein LOC133204760 [Saccostrea echinata]